MRILASGDWQIGLHPNLGKRPGDRLRDQAELTQRIAALATEHKVDLVLLAGDLLEGPAATPEDLAIIADFVEACPCDVLATTGNSRHDLAMRETNGLAIFDRLNGITVASRPGVHRFDGCMVACLPWVSTARLVAMHGGGDRDEINASTAELVLQIASDLYEECRRRAPDLPAILMPHWAISGASTPSGLPADAMPEPVLSLDDLLAIGFDVIPAAHIHRPQWTPGAPYGWTTPSAEGGLTFATLEPAALYVGSPMCLDFGESGHPHGVWILDVDEGVRAEFVPIESRRFITLNSDLTRDGLDVGSLDFSGFTHADVGEAIVRLRITATSAQMRALNTSALVDQLLAAGAQVVKLDPHTVHESRARVTDVERPDEITEAEWLDRWMDVTETPEDARADVRAVFAGYLEGAAT